jgi:hypothetical protein
MEPSGVPRVRKFMIYLVFGVPPESALRPTLFIYIFLSCWSPCLPLSSQTPAIRRRYAAMYFSFSSAVASSLIASSQQGIDTLQRSAFTPRLVFSYWFFSIRPNLMLFLYLLANDGSYLCLFRMSTSVALKSSCVILLPI